MSFINNILSIIMGISKIFDLIKKKCPEAIKETKIKDYQGKTIAFDASMVLI